MRHEVFWQRGKAIGARAKLAGSRSANVVIIGGGVAGLTVADELVRRGVEDIVVLEARFCGAGASGRSSGFITPASELGVSELRRRFGDRTSLQAIVGSHAYYGGVQASSVISSHR